MYPCTGLPDQVRSKKQAGWSQTYHWTKKNPETKKFTLYHSHKVMRYCQSWIHMQWRHREKQGNEDKTISEKCLLRGREGHESKIQCVLQLRVRDMEKGKFWQGLNQSSRKARANIETQTIKIWIYRKPLEIGLRTNNNFTNKTHENGCKRMYVWYIFFQ